MPLLRNERVRGLLIQAVVLALVGWAVASIGINTANNLRQRGIASGFDFLGQHAGFDITMHLIPYDEAATYGRAFVVALLNTLLVSVIGIVLATWLGFMIGVARISHNWLLSRLAAAYVETLRNLPLLLQLFFWYFAVLRTMPMPRQSMSLGGMFFLNMRGLSVPRPLFQDGAAGLAVAAIVGCVIWLLVRRWARARQFATGQTFPVAVSFFVLILGLPAVAYFLLGRPIQWEIPELQGFNFNGGYVLIPELVSLVFALTLYTAAFIAEIVRAGILAVPRGQTEAALALGMSRGQLLKLVIVPQALRVIIPPLTSQYLNLTKNSSLAAAIAYPDIVLVFAGTVLMQTGQAVEIIGITMAVYLTISLAISATMNIYNRRIALVER